jgi:SulP family sulfate permease
MTSAGDETERRFRLLRGILPLQRFEVRDDIIAGLTLAALAIPEVMGYTKISGTPVITGLYTILIPMALFAVFGSSRHLVVGADSATAAILAAGLTGMASAGSDEYVALASALALMAAGFLLLARIVGLGFLADFLSRSVLIGFLTGVGVQVALDQFSGMLGIEGSGHGPILKLVHDLEQIGSSNPYAIAVSIGVLAIIIGGKTVSKKIPGALIAVIGAIAVSWAFDLGSRQVHLLGVVPSGLPTIGLPHVDWSWQLFQSLMPTAFAMFIVILAQSAATARAYANRHNEQLSEDEDLVGLGAANIGAAFSGTFVVAGSPTKTQMVDAAGAHSQLAQLTTTLVVLVVLLVLIAPLAYMPNAVLSTIVFLIGVELIDIKGMRQILAERPSEFWVALLTAIVVISFGVEKGIILAMILSLIVHTRHGYWPRNTVVVRSSDGRWGVLPVRHAAQLVPGLIVYRFSHGVYYANAEKLSQEVQDLVKQAAPPLKWLCIDFSAVDDVDFSAADTLRSLYRLLTEKGVRLVFTFVSDDVKAQLGRSHITDMVGRGAYYSTIGDVLDAYLAASAPLSGQAK